MPFEPVPAPRPADHRPPAWLLWGLVLVCLSFMVATGTLFGWWYLAQWHSDSRGTSAEGDGRPRTVTPRGDLSPFEHSVIELGRNVAPTVVHITTLTTQRDSITRNVTLVPEGTGSGFIWDDKGHIVTNYHVIQKADGAQVTLNDGTTWRARLVDSAPNKDLAVLRIDAPRSKLSPIPLGTSNDLQVGQLVFALGNPFGLDHSLTMGIISALGREIESVTRQPIKDVIQTDAAINPGNSGGPLLDSAGRLIGVNTSIYSPSGTSAGIGFAIPVDEVNKVVPELIKSGSKGNGTRR